MDRHLYYIKIHIPLYIYSEGYKPSHYDSILRIQTIKHIKILKIQSSYILQSAPL